jgi:hypothetical protein
MNLMRLLTAGRSLKGGEFASGKYKFPQQTFLPKFASTVRPSTAAQSQFVQTPEAKSELPSLFKELVVPHVKTSPEMAKPIAAVAVVQPAMEQTQKIPKGKVLNRVEGPVATPNRFSLSAWIKALIASWKKIIFPPRSKRKTSSAPVQTEWSLEKVTVVRNDLNESDIEIIAPKAPKAPVAAPVSQPKYMNLSRVKNSGREWIKMTTRLFKTNSPFERIPEGRGSKAERAELAGRI